MAELAGRVLKNYNGYYYVKVDGVEQPYTCKVKGKMKKNRFSYTGTLLCRQRKDLVANRLIDASHLLNQSSRRSILLIQHKDSRNARQLRQRQQLISKDKAEIRRSAGKGRHE